MRRLALLIVGAFAISLFVSPFVACTATNTRPVPGATEATETAPSVLGGAAPAPETPATTSETPVAPVAPTQPTTKPGPMQARPISGGTLRVLSDGKTAVAADADRDQIYVVDLVANQLTATIALQAGDEPGRVVEDAAGLAHVALRGGGAVATIDPVKGVLVARRALCAAPRGLAFDAATGELHVACAGGELVSIAATPTVTAPMRTLKLDRDLRDVVVASDGRLIVSTFRTASILVVGSDGTVGSPQSMSQDTQGRNPGVAWRMIDGGNGNVMVLHELSQQQALGIFPGAYGVQQGCGDGIVTSTVTVVAPDGDTTMPSVPLSGALVGADVAVSPDGSQMAVVSIANSDATGQVQFFETTGGGAFNGSSCWPSVAPSTPTDLGVTGDGLPAPTSYLPPNGQVVAVAYDLRGNVIVQSREPATLQVLTQRKDAVTLSQDSRFDLGQQLFHSATTGQIACVSCHPEGGEDGRVWQFQTLGARRTQSLRGGIMDTAPFHWGGDEANMTSLMKDVFQGRMNGGTVDAARVTALGQWIDQIPTVPLAPPADASVVARGASLFTSAGCVACHAGSDFTNGLNVDVGTGGTFQVPQLHGLALRAPYMHNGCAASLQDRFTSACGGDAKHSVGALSVAQVTDLIGYLETL